jgi:hypothetical protein
MTGRFVAMVLGIVLILVGVLVSLTIMSVRLWACRWRSSVCCCYCAEYFKHMSAPYQIRRTVCFKGYPPWAGNPFSEGQTQARVGREAMAFRTAGIRRIRKREDESIDQRADDVARERKDVAFLAPGIMQDGEWGDQVYEAVQAFPIFAEAYLPNVEGCERERNEQKKGNHRQR